MRRIAMEEYLNTLHRGVSAVQLMETDNPYEASQPDPEPIQKQFDPQLASCPRCQGATEPGFAPTAALSFTSCAQMQRMILRLPESVSRLPWWKRLNLMYYRAHWCRSCGCIMIDTNQPMSEREAKRLARQTPKHPTDI